MTSRGSVQKKSMIIVQKLAEEIDSDSDTDGDVGIFAATMNCYRWEGGQLIQEPSAT